MSELAFSTLIYKNLYAQVVAPNQASMRVLERCGYVLEDVFQEEVFKNGQYFDGYYYSKYLQAEAS